MDGVRGCRAGSDRGGRRVHLIYRTPCRTTPAAVRPPFPARPPVHRHRSLDPRQSELTRTLPGERARLAARPIDCTFTSGLIALLAQRLAPRSPICGDRSAGWTAIANLSRHFRARVVLTTLRCAARHVRRALARFYPSDAAARARAGGTARRYPRADQAVGRDSVKLIAPPPDRCGDGSASRPVARPRTEFRTGAGRKQLPMIKRDMRFIREGYSRAATRAATADPAFASSRRDSGSYADDTGIKASRSPPQVLAIRLGDGAARRQRWRRR